MVPVLLQKVALCVIFNDLNLYILVFLWLWMVFFKLERLNDNIIICMKTQWLIYNIVLHKYNSNKYIANTLLYFNNVRPIDIRNFIKI